MERDVVGANNVFKFGMTANITLRSKVMNLLI
jgi:hypothetical protein